MVDLFSTKRLKKYNGERILFQWMSLEWLDSHYVIYYDILVFIFTVRKKYSSE